MKTSLDKEMNKTNETESTPQQQLPIPQTNVINKIESDNVDLKRCFNIINRCDAKEDVTQKIQSMIQTNEVSKDLSKEDLNAMEKEKLTKIFLNMPQNIEDTTVISGDAKIGVNDNGVDVKKENISNKNIFDKNDSQVKKDEIGFLGNKLNFNTLELRKSLTEQLCEEISMKLGRVFLCKSFLETYIYEKNPYVLNFIYAKDTLGEAKNRVMSSLLVSSFSDLVWNGNIYKHEYLLSKEIMKKYAKALEMNPDNSNYAIVPVFSLDRIKEILDKQEMDIKLLKKKKIIVKKNNENLLFILNIIKNNFLEIKAKGLRIVQRLLFRLNLLDKLYLLKNSSNFMSCRYENSKMKLTTMLDFFNSFNLDSKLQKINKNIIEIAQARTKLEMDLFCNPHFSNSLKSILETDEQNLMQLKVTASEISTNLEENKECLYQLNNQDIFD